MNTVTASSATILCSQCLEFLLELCQTFVRLPVSSVVTIALLLAAVTYSIRRLQSGQIPIEINNEGPKPIPMIPFRIPYFAHIFSFMYDQYKLMVSAKQSTGHGIYALKLGPIVYNVVSDPALVECAMQETESSVSFRPIAWIISSRFFGTPKRLAPLYDRDWDTFNESTNTTLTKEPYLGKSIKLAIRGLEENIPRMISFMDGEIDQQPWERSGDCKLIRSHPPMVDVELMSISNMMGYVSISTLYGKSLLEKFPDLLQDIYTLDYGRNWLLAGIPRWLPFPIATRAHIAQDRIWQATTAWNSAYDVITDGNDAGFLWGDMDDVSELMRQRHAIFKGKGYAPRDRCDISIIWESTVNTSMTVFWMLLHISATPGLADQIRHETARFVQLVEPVSINGISETPKMNISHEELCKHCPVLQASFYETLRLTSQPSSIRKVTKDATLSSRRGSLGTTEAYLIKKGAYFAVPHALHALDSTYYPEPRKFNPQRFLVVKNGQLVVDTKTTHPWGGGVSMCKGRVFAEKLCLSLVAGVLAYYDFNPSDPSGYKIPSQRKGAAVSQPYHGVRVKISRRRFDWEK